MAYKITKFCQQLRFRRLQLKFYYTQSKRIWEVQLKARGVVIVFQNIRPSAKARLEYGFRFLQLNVVEVPDVPAGPILRLQGPERGLREILIRQTIQESQTVPESFLGAKNVPLQYRRHTARKGRIEE